MSRKISLRKALQLKKTLTGEIAKLTAKAKQFNSQKVANQHIDVSAVLAELAVKTEQLIVLKTAIAQANVPIYEKILTVDEMKSRIAFFEGLDVSETSVDFVPGVGRQEVQNTVAVNYAQRESLVKECQERLQAALDAVDEFNSSHFITIDF